MAGGINGNATPAGLGRTLDRGVVGAARVFDAAEKVAVGVVFKTCVRKHSKPLAWF